MASNLCALNKFTVLKIEEYIGDNSNLFNTLVCLFYITLMVFTKYPKSVIGCLNTNNFIFSFLFFYFSDFILIFFSCSFIFILDDEEAYDIAVT